MALKIQEQHFKKVREYKQKYSDKVLEIKKAAKLWKQKYAEHQMRKIEKEEKKKKLDKLDFEQAASFREKYNIGLFGMKDRRTAFIQWSKSEEIARIARVAVQDRYRWELLNPEEMNGPNIYEEAKLIMQNGGFAGSLKNPSVYQTFWKYLYPEAFIKDDYTEIEAWRAAGALDMNWR